MPDNRWKETIKHWRTLPVEERRRRHLEAIPRHVANSMAMEGEPVDEAWIQERLVRRIQLLATSKPPSAS
ncbi:MAG: hypothetical protein F4X01_05810 [Nitrospira sp. SB0661_bin_20]|nr:hypothetical protein [Nitrospira sp. SB0661_bin_20]MYJ21978.1 hypothetical protein [Nitrospira sp. SB0673_bin_12]